MKDRGLGAYIIGSGDPHGSEYVHPYWQLRERVSGFTGSAGTLVATMEKAGLWTDGRYFIQAGRQLRPGIELYRVGVQGTPPISRFLGDGLPDGAKIGFDGRSVSHDWFAKLKGQLEGRGFAYAYDEDVAGQLWEGRPPLMPEGRAFEHLPEFAGLSAAEKLARVREKMKEKGYSGYLVSALDDVAWLLNIRGSDAQYAPLVYAYALVTERDARVFAAPGKLADVAKHLEAMRFELRGYDELPGFLRAHDGARLYFNAGKTSALAAAGIGCKTESAPEKDIIPIMKAVKTERELANMRAACLREGAALARLLMWLDGHKEAGTVGTLRESDVADKMSALRAGTRNYLHDSFRTIVAYGPNAAQAHYGPEGRGAPLRPEGFLLVDTGGQYLDGTTDTTRTAALGPLTGQMKRDFTLVLKGHIAIDRAAFPATATGHSIDALGRQAMWEEGADFMHGIGHGIGYCLSVHEGPQSIAQRPSVPLQAGMVLSNEPALYRENGHGIRTENMMAVERRKKTDFGDFLGFETLMFCPIDRAAIVPEMLTETEWAWLDSYHAQTREKLAPLLDGRERAWLEEATRPL